LLAGAGRDAEQAELGVDRVQPAVLAEAHPRDVVTDGLGAPAGQCRLQHREVRLAARARERGRHVVGLVLRRDQLEDQHVLGEPALVARHRRGDAQRVALLAEQRVAAVPGAVAPDRARLGEVRDVLRVVAGPRDVLLARLERLAHRVQRRHELALGAVLGDELVQRLLAHPGHDPHRSHDVREVGDLDTELRVIVAERTHAEGNDVHRPTTHAAPVELRHGRLHLVRVHPVVGGPGVLLPLGADEGALLDPRDVARVRRGPVRVRPFVELDERASLDQFLVDAFGFLVGAVDPHHQVRGSQLRALAHPRQHTTVRGRCVVQPWDGYCSHLFSCLRRQEPTPNYIVLVRAPLPATEMASHTADEAVRAFLGDSQRLTAELQPQAGERCRFSHKNDQGIDSVVADRRSDQRFFTECLKPDMAPEQSRAPGTMFVPGALLECSAAGLPARAAGRDRRMAQLWLIHWPVAESILATPSTPAPTDAGPSLHWSEPAEAAESPPYPPVSVVSVHSPLPSVSSTTWLPLESITTATSAWPSPSASVKAMVLPSSVSTTAVSLVPSSLVSIVAGPTSTSPSPRSAVIVPPELVSCSGESEEGPSDISTQLPLFASYSASATTFPLESAIA